MSMIKKAAGGTAIVVFVTAVMTTILALPSWASATKAIIYLSTDDFLKQSFSGDVPEPRTVWIKGTLKSEIHKTLEHDYPALRVRYWLKGDRSAWILDEIGKEKPLTAGFIIQNNKLERVRLLVFRESRGDEVRYPSFTEQFTGASLNSKQQLDRRIDGISGATLSVNAIRKLAAVALQLSDHIAQQQAN
ncbi:MAG: FMN-binding protein [Pseudomonadota bacterium]|nr:FMN-binding protein [Pseudomonadota bacterium]